MGGAGGGRRALLRQNALDLLSRRIADALGGRLFDGDGYAAVPESGGLFARWYDDGHEPFDPWLLLEPLTPVAVLAHLREAWREKRQHLSVLQRGLLWLGEDPARYREILGADRVRS